ncbi:hypothetical protein [Photobacterium galatheae]|uniref:Uncharacterized protein n=1 Tax=Photobacterium galatheae TaxID=1654360 RepID=A0A066RHK8_9GAMM|nr:hypothetical protein [Photobacterium galatheae]KDM89794.1 hypothetical protein EA58_20290 [Photobacterium galatheae]MCM0151445.1 hypothetical protein [Photobacterium galatheae]
MKKLHYLVRVTQVPPDLISASQNPDDPLYSTAQTYSRLAHSDLLWKVWAVDEDDQIWLEVNFSDQNGEEAFHTLKLDAGTYQKIDYDDYIVSDFSDESEVCEGTDAFAKSMEHQPAVAWLSTYFKDRHAQIAKILNIGGCRELWMQGDIYLYLNDNDLRTNATRYKFDIYKKGHFAIELKILGGQYQRKVLNDLENDFRKLSSNAVEQDQYVVLVLDNSSPETKLYSQLSNYAHPAGNLISQSDFGAFCIRIWKVAQSVAG